MGARADILCWVLHWGGGLKLEEEESGDATGRMLLLGVGA